MLRIARDREYDAQPEGRAPPPHRSSRTQASAGRPARSSAPVRPSARNFGGADRLRPLHRRSGRRQWIRGNSCPGTAWPKSMRRQCWEVVPPPLADAAGDFRRVAAPAGPPRRVPATVIVDLLSPSPTLGRGVDRAPLRPMNDAPLDCGVQVKNPSARVGGGIDPGKDPPPLSGRAVFRRSRSRAGADFHVSPCGPQPEHRKVLDGGGLHVRRVQVDMLQQAGDSSFATGDFRPGRSSWRISLATGRHRGSRHASDPPASAPSVPAARLSPAAIPPNHPRSGEGQ